MHNNLKFTCEYGGTEIPFLDTKVFLSTNGVRTNVYRKNTDTGVILNQSAVAPTQWKKSLTSCFLHRAKIICSDETSYKLEIEKLRNIFYQNNYPKEFFEQAMMQFEKRQKEKQMTTDNKENNKNEHDKKDFKLLVKIPYIGKMSLLFGKRLKLLIRNRLDKEIWVSYETTKVKDSFKLKDNIPKEICSQIVYKFTCPGDPDISYIGHTIRSLRERAKEHLNPNIGTAVGNHIITCDKCQAGVSIDNFSILRRCRTKIESAVQEALLIKQQRPILNKQLQKSSGYSFTLKIFGA